MKTASSADGGPPHLRVTLHSSIDRNFPGESGCLRDPGGSAESESLSQGGRESKSQRTGLASGDPRDAGISVWNFSFQVTRRKGQKRKKNQKKTKVSSDSIPHECCSVSYIRASRGSRRRP